MLIHGYLSDYDGEILTIKAPFEAGYLLDRRSITECEIRLDDGRQISAIQRRHIYALLRDISLWSGHTPEELKEIMKCDFLAQTGGTHFSLSDVDMTTAKDFLQFLIEFCLKWEIPCRENLISHSPDIARYLYACLVHKRCCISGKKAELHHLDAVGSGRSRKEIIHRGMRVLPLGREYHVEIHTIGRESFCEKYHVFGIAMDDDLCKIWKVKG